MLCFFVLLMVGFVLLVEAGLLEGNYRNDEADFKTSSNDLYEKVINCVVDIQTITGRYDKEYEDKLIKACVRLITIQNQ